MGVLTETGLVRLGLTATITALLASVAAGADTLVREVWPTPNPAYLEGRPFKDFVQPTESGLIESGLFGCGRTDGRQFHEGLDLFPLKRDKRGEAADPVFAILPGVVRHASGKAGASTYGRYVVVEHGGERIPVVSLYAHLAAIEPGVRPGSAVQAGQVLGLMGRSASAYTIPRERAHVHLEAGLWLSRNFQSWYDGRDYKTRNEHGLFNGQNIVGFDYLDYLDRRRAGQVRDMAEYVARQPTAVSVVIASRMVPDFVERHPMLLRARLPAGGLAGWRIDFTWYGLPVGWWPLDSEAVAQAGKGGPSIVFHDQALLERHPCQSVVRQRGGLVQPGNKLSNVLEILFQ